MITKKQEPTINGKRKVRDITKNKDMNANKMGKNANKPVKKQQP